MLAATAATAMPAPAARLTGRTGPTCWSGIARSRWRRSAARRANRRRCLIGLDPRPCASSSPIITGHAPVLLLDEIAAHLDEGRARLRSSISFDASWRPGLHDRHRSLDVFRRSADRAQFFTVARWPASSNDRCRFPRACQADDMHRVHGKPLSPEEIEPRRDRASPPSYPAAGNRRRGSAED